MRFARTAGQPLTSPAANLNAVLGNLAGLDSLKAISKRMPGYGAAYPPRAVGARPAAPVQQVDVEPGGEQPFDEAVPGSEVHDVAAGEQAEHDQQGCTPPTIATRHCAA